MCATNPLVNGTVASQSAPMTKLNTTAVLTVMGVKMNQAEITTRAAYTLLNQYFLE